MAKARESGSGGGASHFGTLAFPIVALAYNAWFLGINDHGKELGGVMLFGSVATVIILLGMGAVSWRFLKENPTAGLFFAGVLFFMTPVTYLGLENSLLRLLFGAAAALGGGVGLLYFLILGIIDLRSE